MIYIELKIAILLLIGAFIGYITLGTYVTFKRYHNKKNKELKNMSLFENKKGSPFDKELEDEDNEEDEEEDDSDEEDKNHRGFDEDDFDRIKALKGLTEKELLILSLMDRKLGDFDWDTFDVMIKDMKELRGN